MLKRARELADARLVKPAETIQRAAARMEHMITDLLDMASIQAGVLKVERRRERVASLVDDAFEVHEPVAHEKGVALLADTHVEGLEIECDRQRILQVFGNLLGNALKFSRRGDTITFGAAREGDCVVFSIADQGPGLGDDELRHIFEPYWSADKRGKSGTGLGLFIARGIVAAHGGRIWAESRPGAGATFHVRLPLAVSGDRAGGAAGP